jgi:hypothetical protein
MEMASCPLRSPVVCVKRRIAENKRWRVYALEGNTGYNLVCSFGQEEITKQVRVWVGEGSNKGFRG